MSWLENAYDPYGLGMKINRTIEIDLAEYNQLAMIYNHWTEIENLAYMNPIVQHHLDELLTAIKLVKG